MGSEELTAIFFCEGVFRRPRSRGLCSVVREVGSGRTGRGNTVASLPWFAIVSLSVSFEVFSFSSETVRFRRHAVLVRSSKEIEMHGSGLRARRLLFAISLVIAARWPLLVPQLAQSTDVCHLLLVFKTLTKKFSCLPGREDGCVLGRSSRKSLAPDVAVGDKGSGIW